MMSTNHSTIYKPREWETVACPFCGSTNSYIYERYGSELQFTYVICRNCKLVYQSPRPKYNQEFIDAAYASYYQFTESLDLLNGESLLYFFQIRIINLRNNIRT